MRSITITDPTLATSWTELPTWARYAVVYAPPLAYPVTRPSITQAFVSRVAAERWALACARALPAGSVIEVGFVLVYALAAAPSLGRGLRTFHNGCAVCYRAIDPGGRIVKDHRIPQGFGVVQSRTVPEARL